LIVYRIGIDVGGTFTDFVAVDEDGSVTIAKSPSTPDDQSEGVLNGLAVLAAELHLDIAGLLTRTSQIVHGTTVATNALLERRGAKVGMLTTDGHRDIIEQREGLKPERYNLRLPPAPALVPRSLRVGVRERIRHDGTVSTALCESSVRECVAKLNRARVDSVAICYLHSYRNPVHERETRRIVREMMPEAYISLSSEVLSQIKEYERFSTTVANAFVGRQLSSYLFNLERRLCEAGYTREILVMHSHGGVGTIADSSSLAAGCILSGPAGGIAGARHAACLTATADLISFDMGGTSTDIAVLEDGEAMLSGDREIAGIKIAFPSLDIHTIGSGGGSIARVEAGGILRVGPASAGAVPGPACYGRGGQKPTVTDANVTLGYYGDAGFLGGNSDFLAVAAAVTAIEPVARALDCSVIEAAEGIQQVVNTQMAEGVRVAAVRRGVDLRKYTLLSFGGAAGLHATDVARMLEIKHVIVPRVASVLSAWGMLTTDLRYEFSRSYMTDVSDLAPMALLELFEEMEVLGRAKLAGRPDESIAISRSLDMRYGEQIFEINVPLDGVDLTSPSAMRDIAVRFHCRHEELYTYRMQEQDLILVNLRLSAIGRLKSLPSEIERPTPIRRPPSKSRKIYINGWQEVPVFEISALVDGDQVKGPAIIDSPITTILLRELDRARSNANCWLDIEVGQ
jgi:N-methylhydantoinase A